jgi:hypothetical protein
VAREKTTVEKMKAKVIKDMKGLSVYKKEYDRLIDIYVDLNIQYDIALEEFVKSGYECETETAAGGTKKSALVGTLENLRKDILAYSDRLCLNPKVLDGIKIQTEKKSILSEALKGL